MVSKTSYTKNTTYYIIPSHQIQSDQHFPEGEDQKLIGKGACSNFSW